MSCPDEVLAALRTGPAGPNLPQARAEHTAPAVRAGLAAAAAAAPPGRRLLGRPRTIAEAVESVLGPAADEGDAQARAAWVLRRMQEARGYEKARTESEAAANVGRWLQYALPAGCTFEVVPAGHRDGDPLEAVESRAEAQAAAWRGAWARAAAQAAANQARPTLAEVARRAREEGRRGSKRARRRIAAARRRRLQGT